MWTLHLLREQQQQAAAAPPPQDHAGPPLPLPLPSPSPFTPSELLQFPVLRTRNYWCIQRHQATALHYDLRLRVGDGLHSWAVPRGLLGMSRTGDAARLAVETPVHTLWHALREGPEPRPGCGTLLWDVGRYTIRELNVDNSESQGARRGESDSDSDDGAFEEEKLRLVLRLIDEGKNHSFHIVLHSGRKMTNHEYALILPQKSRHKYKSNSEEKREWLLRLPQAVDEYSWGPGGEEGEEYGRSVKSGLPFSAIKTPAGKRRAE